jgi:hypothetical protein
MIHSWKPGIIAALLLAGCAGATSPPEDPGTASGAGSTSTGSPFPSEAEVDRLAGQAAPEALEALKGYDVDEWEFVGPFPERVEVVAASGDTTWEKLLAEEAQRRVGLAVPTEAMHCVARQIGHFFLANRALPTNGLESYIASRCNAAVPSYQIGYVHADLPDGMPEGEIFEQWQAQLAERIRSLMTGGPRTVGIWFGRDGDSAVAVMVAGSRAVRVDPVDAIPNAEGRILLRGEVLSPATEVSATVGRGRFGYAMCDSDPNVSLPRFAFSCETDPGDKSAIVSIGYRPPGRLLGKAGLNLLVWPSGKPDSHYERSSYGVKREVTTAQAMRSRFVELLNDVRAEAGLQPVVEAKNQSAVASELAPHYFAAARGIGPERNADVVVMGMLAGWSVEGLLQTGHFTAAWVTQTNDVNRLLSEALQFPNARAVLLAADIDKIAIGALIESNDETSALAAVVGTYSLFSETEHSKNAALVYERFQAERARRGLRPADRLEEIEPSSMAAAGRVQAGASPTDALNYLLQSSVDLLQRPVNGWIGEVSKLEDLKFPDDFLDRTSLGIAIGVSYHKPDDEPWGRYVVMLVAADPHSQHI